MTISVGIMVASFRETVQLWLEHQLRADFYLRAAGQITAGVFPPIAPEVARIVAATPGVDEMDAFHAFTFRYEGEQATLGAGISDIARRRNTLRFLDGDGDAILRSLPERNRVIVSEPFANKHHLRQGDELRIALGNRSVAFKVAGIYYDYSSHRGFVIADWSTMRKYLPDLPVTDIAIYVKRRKCLQGATRTGITARSISGFNGAERGAAASGRVIFDRTFAVTWALEGIAIDRRHAGHGELAASIGIGPPPGNRTDPVSGRG